MITTLELINDLSAADMNEKLMPSSGDKSGVVADLQNVLAGIVSGRMAANLKVTVNPIKASGTVTLASVLAADTVTVAGTVFTAVSGTPTGAQFDISGSDTADAVSLVAAINAHATVSKYVVASSALGVVTLTAVVAGNLGNLVTLASSNGTRLAVSGAVLSGGSNATAYSFDYARVATLT